MIRKKIGFLAVCAFAFGMTIASSAGAFACNNTCRLGCETALTNCENSGGTRCWVDYYNCYRRCGCVLP
ncbi:hypothetical protein K4L06_13845 [Lysobacter sp. BMK333-48F3]|uniref:hypothetical protein n=1 Tax=Lysobacter sp. BMK333-48F3 TaxID=2867962 RepID=UPI001C8B2C63|nr:hypothetical protein [Lysobacter sp. BMK333-48F3]MBX9402393.1 hypothetical protein [Lysobacter sp. BMK333-48F3]